MPTSSEPGEWAAYRLAGVRSAAIEIAADLGRADSPTTAIVAVLAGALELVVDDKRPQLLLACGAIRSVVGECADYLDQLLDQVTLINSAPSSSS